jgi:hypothetical protein
MEYGKDGSEQCGRPNGPEGWQEESPQGVCLDGRSAEEGDSIEGREGAVAGKAENGSGYIYFIETEDGQYVKIGFSKRVMVRMSELGTLEKGIEA